jgi:hypothetical protein
MFSKNRARSAMGGRQRTGLRGGLKVSERSRQPNSPEFGPPVTGSDPTLENWAAKEQPSPEHRIDLFHFGAVFHFETGDPNWYGGSLAILELQTPDVRGRLFLGPGDGRSPPDLTETETSPGERFRGSGRRWSANVCGPRFDHSTTAWKVMVALALGVRSPTATEMERVAEL